MRVKAVLAVLALTLLSQRAMAQSYIPENVAIINAEAENLSGAASTNWWTPTEDQAKAAYKALAAALRDPNLRTPSFHDRAAQAKLAERLDQYRLQIRGRIARAGSDASISGPPGEKMIFIFGICPEEKVEHWRTGAIVADGGACFFNAHYDPRKDKILFFAFNGN